MHIPFARFRMFGALIVLALLLPLMARAQTNLCTAQPSDGGAYQYDPFGNNCHTVTNNTGATICVFTGEQDHWNRFTSGPWGGVGIGDCGPSCTQGGCPPFNQYGYNCGPWGAGDCQGGTVVNYAIVGTPPYDYWGQWDCYDSCNQYYVTSCSCYSP